MSVAPDGQIARARRLDLGHHLRIELPGAPRVHLHLHLHLRQAAVLVVLGSLRKDLRARE